MHKLPTAFQLNQNQNIFLLFLKLPTILLILENTDTYFKLSVITYSLYVVKKQ